MRKPGGRFLEAPPIPAALLAPADRCPRRPPPGRPRPRRSPRRRGHPVADVMATADAATGRACRRRRDRDRDGDAPDRRRRPRSRTAPRRSPRTGRRRVADAAYEDGGELHALFGVARPPRRGRGPALRRRRAHLDARAIDPAAPARRLRDPAFDAAGDRRRLLGADARHARALPARRGALGAAPADAARGRRVPLPAVASR